MRWRSSRCAFRSAICGVGAARSGASAWVVQAAAAVVAKVLRPASAASPTNRGGLSRLWQCGTGADVAPRPPVPARCGRPRWAAACGPSASAARPRRWRLRAGRVRGGQRAGELASRAGRGLPSKLMRCWRGEGAKAPGARKGRGECGTAEERAGPWPGRLCSVLTSEEALPGHDLEGQDAQRKQVHRVLRCQGGLAQQVGGGDLRWSVCACVCVQGGGFAMGGAEPTARGGPRQYITAPPLCGAARAHLWRRVAQRVRHVCRLSRPRPVLKVDQLPSTLLAAGVGHGAGANGQAEAWWEGGRAGVQREQHGSRLRLASCHAQPAGQRQRRWFPAWQRPSCQTAARLGTRGGGRAHPKNMMLAGRMSICTRPMLCSWLSAQATSCSRIFCCCGGGCDLRSTSASVKSPRSVMMKGGRSSEPSCGADRHVGWGGQEGKGQGAGGSAALGPLRHSTPRIVAQLAQLYEVPPGLLLPWAEVNHSNKQRAGASPPGVSPPSTPTHLAEVHHGHKLRRDGQRVELSLAVEVLHAPAGRQQGRADMRGAGVERAGCCCARPASLTTLADRLAGQALQKLLSEMVGRRAQPGQLTRRT